jgi:hypothetical protein
MLRPEYFTDKANCTQNVNPKIWENVENIAYRLDDMLKDHGRSISNSLITVMLLFQTLMASNHMAALDTIGILKEYWERDNNQEKLTDQHELLSIEKPMKIADIE